MNSWDSLDEFSASADPMLSEGEDAMTSEPRHPFRPTRFLRTQPRHLWPAWMQECDITPPKPRSLRRTPAPPKDSDSLPAHGAVVSSFSGLRLLRKLKDQYHYLDEDQLMQHEKKFDEHAPKNSGETSDTGEWLKFIKGARARSQAEADRAYQTFCQLTVPEFAQNIATFTGGDSCSEYAAATMDTIDVPDGKHVEDDRDNLFGDEEDGRVGLIFRADSEISTPRGSFRNSFNVTDDDADPFTVFRADEREMEDDFSKYDIFDVMWSNGQS